MTITDSFKKAVSAGDVKGIRIMMKDSLLVDPTLAEFDEMSRLASGVTGLYDQHDGRKLQSDISAWDDNYMDKMMVQVVSNFSKRRLDHLKAVVKHLRPVASRPYSQSTTSPKDASTPRQAGSITKPAAQRPRQRSYQEQKRYDQRKGNYRGVKITAGAVAGGVVGGTIVSVAGGSFFVGFSVGAVVVGAAVAVVTHGG